MDKVCRRCEATKPRDEFPYNSTARDRLSSWCRECHRVRALEVFRQRGVPDERCCPRCGTTYRRNRRYCSNQCLNEADNQRRRDNLVRVDGMEFSRRSHPKEVIAIAELIRETRGLLRHVKTKEPV